jgi:hypothetical protein
MNQDELAQVLRMVSEGKVSVQDAQELIDALQLPSLQDDTLQPDVSVRAPGVSVRAPALPQRAAPTRKLEIGVSEDGTVIAETVIPLALLHADRQFIPRQIRHYLGAFEVDLDALLKQAIDLGLTGTLADLRQDDTNIWIAVK